MRSGSSQRPLRRGVNQADFRLSIQLASYVNAAPGSIRSAFKSIATAKAPAGDVGFDHQGPFPVDVPGDESA